MDTSKTVVAYKGFDMNLKCRDYQFEIGGTYTHDGEVKRCGSGFHSCEFPLHVFDYYSPGTSRFALVEASGEIDREEGGDTKLASAKLHIKAELHIPEIVSAAIQWITARCDTVKAKHSTGHRSAASSTGDQSAASSTGYQSAASSTGHRSAASSTGDLSAASSTGYQSAASSTGYQSAASSTGDLSAASSTGKNAVAMNIGIQGRAKAGKDGAIVLCNHDSDYNIRHIRASKVGENGIKPDTWYVLSDAGEFSEVG